RRLNSRILVLIFFFPVPPTTELSTLPYTTLFRSSRLASGPLTLTGRASASSTGSSPRVAAHWARPRPRHQDQAPSRPAKVSSRRSEEHTSELQSRENLVCRLLLEKKKKTHRLRLS